MKVIEVSRLSSAVMSIAGAAMRAERRASDHAAYNAPACQELAESDAARLWREALSYIGNDGEAWDNRRGL